VKRLFPRTVIALSLIFLYLPIMILILYSFNDSKSALNWTGFSLRWYGALIQDRTIMTALKTTLILALISSTLSVAAGLLSSWGIIHFPRRPRELMLKVNDLPLINPDLVTGISLMALFLFLRLKFGFGTLLIAHLSFCIPYVVVTILPQMRALADSQMEAALDLGASPFRCLTRIILPQLRAAILSSWLIAFTLSVDDFVISFFTTGSGVNNVSIVVYSMARRGINPKINALSTLLLGVIFLTLVLINSKKYIKKENYTIEKDILLHEFRHTDDSREPDSALLRR